MRQFITIDRTLEPRERKRLARWGRLFNLLEHLRGRRYMTIESIAAYLKVGQRTARRDVADLQAMGIPVTMHRWEGATERRVFLRLAPGWCFCKHPHIT